MSFLGINFTTKKQLRENIVELEKENAKLEEKNEMLELSLKSFKEEFPFVVHQVVYDLQLKDEKGRFTTQNPSFEHSAIYETVVSGENYFNLVERYHANDVFFTHKAAEDYLKSICK